LQAYAEVSGCTLSTLLFGSLGRNGSEGSRTGGQAAPLPPLPSRKELGIKREKAMKAVEDFRQLIASLHATAATRTLGETFAEILVKVLERCLLAALFTPWVPVRLTT